MAGVVIHGGRVTKWYGSGEKSTSLEQKIPNQGGGEIINLCEYRGSKNEKPFVIHISNISKEPH